MAGGRAWRALFGGLHVFAIASVKLAPSLFLQMATNWKQNTQLSLCLHGFKLYVLCHSVQKMIKWMLDEGEFVSHTQVMFYLILICCI